MGSRVIGIVGEGNAMTHFMSERGSALLGERKRDFFSSLDGVVFYNHSYKNNEIYLEKKWGPYLNTFDSWGLNYHAHDGFGAKDDFSDFVASCDVIIDGTRGFRFPSILQAAQALTSRRIGVDEINLSSKDCESDFSQYRAREDVLLRRMWDKRQFNDEWEMAYQILKAVAQVNSGYIKADSEEPFKIGWRVLTELPFTAPIFIERGVQMHQVLNQGVSAPTYINLANEPCITSAILSSNCPIMSEYIVAVGGFDISRLQRVFQDNAVYASIMKQCGVSIEELDISLRGFHDQNVMIPIIQDRVHGSNAVDRLLRGGLQYERMFNFLNNEVGAYYNNFNPETGIRDRRDVNEEIDVLLLDLAQDALLSQGKALSVFPDLSRPALCNGIFQRVHDSGSSLFLMGNHRFRNGKVVCCE